MARTPADRSNSTIRERLTAASAKLSEVKSPDLAAAVEQVLAPGGWELLRSTDALRGSGTEPNMAINLLKTVKEQIEAAVAADPGTPSVTAKVNEGFRKFLAGEFQLMRGRASMGEELRQERANLNVRPSSVLRKQIEDRGGAPSKVASQYLMFSYQLGPYASDAPQPVERGAERIPRVPRVVLEQIRVKASENRSRVDDVVNEGFQKFLAGEFDPEPLVWSQEATSVLKMRPNDDLYEQVKDATKGTSLRPLLVALAYLVDEYGITEGVAHPE